jgi:hypothetical protein
MAFQRNNSARKRSSMQERHRFPVPTHSFSFFALLNKIARTVLASQKEYDLRASLSGNGTSRQTAQNKLYIGEIDG